MSDPITVEVAGKESAHREAAWRDASKELARELHRRGLIDVSDARWKVHVARPGRFYATASVKAVPR